MQLTTYKKNGKAWIVVGGTRNDKYTDKCKSGFLNACQKNGLNVSAGIVQKDKNGVLHQLFTLN